MDILTRLRRGGFTPSPRKCQMPRTHECLNPPLEITYGQCKTTLRKEPIYRKKSKTMETQTRRVLEGHHQTGDRLTYVIAIMILERLRHHHHHHCAAIVSRGCWAKASARCFLICLSCAILCQSVCQHSEKKRLYIIVTARVYCSLIHKRSF